MPRGEWLWHHVSGGRPHPFGPMGPPAGFPVGLTPGPGGHLVNNFVIFPLSDQRQRGFAVAKSRILVDI